MPEIDRRNLRKIVRETIEPWLRPAEQAALHTWLATTKSVAFGTYETGEVTCPFMGATGMHPHRYYNTHSPCHPWGDKSPITAFDRAMRAHLGDGGALGYAVTVTDPVPVEVPLVPEELLA